MSFLCSCGRKSNTVNDTYSNKSDLSSKQSSRKSNPGNQKNVSDSSVKSKDILGVRSSSDDSKSKRVEDGRTLLLSSLVRSANDAPSKSLPMCVIPLEYVEHITKKWENILQRATFGTIYKGIDHEANIELAVKSLRSERRSLKYQAIFQEEVQRLSSLRHPNIVRVLASCYETDFNLILPLPMGGTVPSILWRECTRKRFTPAARLYVVQCLVSAVQHLHQRNILHRDIKPEHLWLLYENWYENPHAILMDFGISSSFSNTDVVNLINVSNQETNYYMAPETLEQNHFDMKTDVYSIGVSIASLLVTNVTRVPTLMDCSTQDLLDTVDDFGGQWSEDILRDFATLVSRCMKRDPNHRPTVEILFEEITRLRERNGALDRLPEEISLRVTSHSELSMRTENLEDVTSPKICVLCGFLSKRGIVCTSGHYTCSRDTCLESVARENMGSESIPCPSERCSGSFFLRDLFDKINADVYGELVLATDRNYDYRHKFKVLNGKISSLETNVDRKLFVEELTLVRVDDDEISELSEPFLNESIMSLISEAGKIEHDELKLDSRRRRIETSLLRSQDDSDKILEMLEKILKNQEELKLQRAEGIKLLAQGQLQCPQLFVLIPVVAISNSNQRFVVYNQYRMYFLCSHDYTMVETAITLKQPKSWFRLVCPALLCNVLSLRLVVSAYGISLSVPNYVQSVSGYDTFDDILRHMEFLVHQSDGPLDSVSKGVGNCASYSDMTSFIQELRKSIPPEAYGAIAIQACKPENREWMDKMEIASRGAEFAWVKKENSEPWKRSRIFSQSERLTTLIESEKEVWQRSRSL